MQNEKPKTPESLMLFITRESITGTRVGALGSVEYSDRSKKMIKLSLETGLKLLAEFDEQIEDIRQK